MLKEFCEFIEDRTTFIVGTTIQVGFRPQEAPDRCSVVLESIGGAPSFDLPDRIDQSIQILSRGNDLWEARDDAWEIFNALTGNVPGVIQSAQWTLPVVDGAFVACVIEAISSPQIIGRDDRGRFEYSTNYIVKIRDA